MPISKRVNTFIAVLFTLGLTTLSVQASESISAEKLKQDIVQRQTAFSHIDKQQEQMAELLNGTEFNWQQLASLSTALNANSSSLQHLFVVGSQSGSKAKGKIWDDNQKFKAALAKMGKSFVLMDNAIKQQDSHAAKTALKQANNTCRSCHRQYRSRW